MDSHMSIYILSMVPQPAGSRVELERQLEKGKYRGGQGVGVDELPTRFTCKRKKATIARSIWFAVPLDGARPWQWTRQTRAYTWFP